MNFESFRTYLVDRYYLEFTSSKRSFSFSPMLELVTGIGIHYLESSRNQPLWIHLPKLCFSHGWMSTLLACHFFHDDYFEYTGDYLTKLKLKRGDKVTLYGATAEFEKIEETSTSKHVLLVFKDVSRAEIKLNNVLALQKTKKTSLNKYKYYTQKKRKIEANRSLLESTLDIDIANNRSILKSKLIVVSGPGERNKLTNFFQNTRIGDHKLCNLVGYGKNLIVRKDLSDLAVEINKKLLIKEKIEYLLSLVKHISKSPYLADQENILLEIKELIIRVEKTSLVKKTSLEILDKAHQNSPESHKNKWAKLIKLTNEVLSLLGNDLFSFLRVVVIADIQIAFEYSETIKKLTDLNIGVVVLSDNRFMYPGAESRFEHFFSKFPNAVRFNLSREKIKCLKNETEKKYQDLDFFKACKAFEEQEILIRIHSEDLIDEAYRVFEGRGAIYKLEDFELLKRSYRENLRPLIFLLKNSIFNSDIEKSLTVESRFWKFLNDLSIVIYQLPKENQELILYGVDKIDDYLKRIKDGYIPQKITSLNDYTGYMFHEEEEKIAQSGKNLNKKKTVDEHTPQQTTIIFPGFPQFEYGNRRLVKSVTDYQFPRTVLLSTRWESMITTSYLNRYINNYKFKEQFPKNDNWPNDLISEESQEKILIHQENCEYNIDTNEKSDLIDIESLWFDIGESQISRYVASREIREKEYVVDAVLIYFKSYYLFLPKNSRIICLKEENDKRVVKYEKVNLIGRGDKIVFWKNEKEVLNKLLNDIPQMNEVFKKFNLWRNELQNILERFKYDYGQVEEYLRKIESRYKINSDLNRNNLLRWQKDEQLLAPRENNIRLLFYANSDYTKDEIDNNIKQIRAARQEFLRNRSRLQNRLNKIIQENINKDEERSLVKLPVLKHGGIQLDLEIIEVLGKKHGYQKVNYANTHELISRII